MKYFFIVGTGRSGTTLLQAMLMRAEGVFIPPETQFLEYTWRHRRRIGDLRNDGAWVRVSSAVMEIVERNEIALDREAFARELGTADRTYGSLFRQLLDAIAREAGATCIGEKSPVHTPYVFELLDMFRDAQVIQILRDPRDVAVSQKEAWGTTALQAALRWRRDARLHRQYAERLGPSTYLAVRYEDLVRNPRGTVEQLCRFLGFGFRPQMLEPHNRAERGFAAFERHKIRTLEPVTTARVGRFEEELAPVDGAVIEWLCGPRMRALGYDPRGHPRWRAVLGAATQVAPLLWLHARRQWRLSRGGLLGSGP